MPPASSASLVIALAALTLLGACSTPTGDFPSLEKRSYETDDPIAEPADVPVEVAAKLGPELQGKANALLARYRAGQAAFDAGLPEIRRIAAAAAGSKPGTEAWVNAHLRLSRLDKARSESVGAQRDIDDLVSQTGDLDLNGGPIQAPLLAPIQREISTGAASQNQIIDQLSRQIGE